MGIGFSLGMGLRIDKVSSMNKCIFDGMMFNEMGLLGKTKMLQMLINFKEEKTIKNAY